MKELKRFRYESLEYIVGLNIIEYKGEEIAWPWIMITNKSSKKKRGKSNSKSDAHFKLVGLKNPWRLTRMIYKIFDYAFQNYDHILLEAYEDRKWKRLELYESFLKKMGFKVIKKSKDKWFFSKRSPKKKLINDLGL